VSDHPRLHRQVLRARHDERTFSALLEEHQSILWRIARQYYAPGLSQDDLDQEARIGFHKAIRDFNPAAGASFRTFVHLTVERQVLTALKAATRLKHRPVNQAVPIDAPISAEPGEDRTLADVLASPELTAQERLEVGERLAPLRRLPIVLSELEQLALVGVANGASYEDIARANNVRFKTVDNAVQRARAKARALIEPEREEHRSERPTDPAGTEVVAPRPLREPVPARPAQGSHPHRRDPRPPHRHLRAVRDHVARNVGRGRRPAGGGMSALLQALWDERGAELARHELALERLDALEELANQYIDGTPTNGDQPDVLSPADRDRSEAEEKPGEEGAEADADPAPPAAEPPPVEGTNTERALAVLASGPATRADIMRRANIPSGSIGQTMDALQRAGQVEREDVPRPGGGRPTPTYTRTDIEVGDASPEPAAARATDPRPRRGRADDQDLRDANVSAAEQSRQRLLDALGDDHLTNEQLADRLGESPHRVLGLLTHLKRGGYVDTLLKPAENGRHLWERLKTPAETPGLTVRNGGGNVTETQVRECLRHGTYTLHSLARELGSSAADVGLTIAALEYTGEVTRIADGHYRLNEQVAA
jgi:RNA polymerase sigma-H factor